MLNVALEKLPACGPQQMLPGYAGERGRQRHAILKLVAEAKRAARLVERGAGPHAAGESLVQEPAVNHDVHRSVGRANLDGTEDVIPVTVHL